jgi:hypothetical protein
MDRERAQEHIEELRGFYGHLASYIGVNLFLFMINITTNPGEWWFIYPLGGWGIGLFCHAFSVFYNDAEWEERKMQELTGWTTTQEELDRLAERTETLVRILSSVDWKAIDPELLQSKENLLKAQARMSGPAANDESKEEVIRELEKLEAFVTSSKFDYYEKAADVRSSKD